MKNEKRTTNPMNIFLCFFFESIHLQPQPVGLVKPSLFTVQHQTPFNVLATSYDFNGNNNNTGTDLSICYSFRGTDGRQVTVSQLLAMVNR